jgi:hypothetical protein
MPDDNGYPTKDELQYIGTCHAEWLEKGHLSSIEKLLVHLQKIWNWPEWGFVRTYDALELHTGGWSGNETIIEELQKTCLWWLFWQKTTRGGHYFFDLKGLKD